MGDRITTSDVGTLFPQYLAAVSASLGAIGTGTMLGWIAPAGPRLKAGEYPFTVTDQDEAWIGSLAILGAACICYPVGFVMEKIGKRLTMLLLVLPYTLGWLLIILATDLAMMYSGRFILGIAGGAFCVTVSAYNSEIVHDSIRGTVGMFFQLMLNVGVLITYAVGGYVKVYVLSIVCAVIPLIFGVIFFFMPESPSYLVSIEKIDEAKTALRWLRGEKYNVDVEIDKIEKLMLIEYNSSESFLKKFSDRASLKALIISFVLMVLLQYSGINVILFNTIYIFDNAGADISSEVSSIIVGVIQVIATLFSSMIIEKSGRKILLLLSSVLIILCNVALGTYFYLDERDPVSVTGISWLPLLSLCVFVVAFSIGCGPVPWVICGEISSSEIKAVIISTAGTFNWLLGFVVTRTYIDMKSAFGMGGVYWFFAGVTFLGMLFEIFVIPETKGKTTSEIEDALRRKKLC